SSFCHDPPTTALSTLSLHDALPICRRGTTRGGSLRSKWDRIRSGSLKTFSRRSRSSREVGFSISAAAAAQPPSSSPVSVGWRLRSEEHTSELQSLRHLVCRLLLEKK